MLEVVVQIFEDCQDSLSEGKPTPRRRAGRSVPADASVAANSLEQARRLISEGFSVIPLDGKVPAVAWKEFQSRLATDAELVRWFGYRGHSIGLVTGGLSGVTVIDCDSQEARELAYGELGIWSNLVQATTRGVHLAFRFDGERNTTGLGGVDGLDRRGEGGYIRCTQPERWTRKAADACRTIAETVAEKP